MLDGLTKTVSSKKCNFSCQQNAERALVFRQFNSPLCLYVSLVNRNPQETHQPVSVHLDSTKSETVIERAGQGASECGATSPLSARLERSRSAPMSLRPLGVCETARLEWFCFVKTRPNVHSARFSVFFLGSEEPENPPCEPTHFCFVTTPSRLRKAAFCTPDVSGGACGGAAARTPYISFGSLRFDVMNRRNLKIRIGPR